MSSILEGSHEREKLKEILFEPYMLATVLYAVALRLYGEQIHEWDPETLCLELKDDFGDEIPRINQDKLQAIVSAVSAPGFYRDWASFCAITQVLNNGEDPMDGHDPLLVAEMCWAVIEVRLNDDTPGTFSEEVSRLVGMLLDEDGFVEPPPELSFADMPERYRGSDTSADMRKDEVAATEHARIVSEYVNEQAALLIKQAALLPWQNKDSLEKLVQDLREAATGTPPAPTA